MNAQSKFVRVNGVRLHYWEWGEPGAPDLLLVHGWTGLGESWTRVAESLRDRYHIIAPDHRGHGESDKPATGYRLRDFFDDMCQLIESMGLKRPALVGNSWGGNIGTMMAAERPDLIERALLEDPVYWKMIHAAVSSLPQALARRARPVAEIRAEAKQRGLTKKQADQEVYRHHHFSAEAVTRLLTDNREWAFACTEYIRRFAVPTLVLAADFNVGGAMLPAELAYYQRIAPPNARFRLWEGVGHGMHSSQPERFDQELAALLAE
jgi:pimeloyl-ACP methyl ester carboxylesterase